MRKTMALLLAVTLVTVSVPALAHQAAYPSECDDRQRRDHCQKDHGRAPAHDQCTGERNWMTSEQDSLAKETISIATPAGANVTAYTYAPGDSTAQQDTGTPMPGLLWMEDNGFSGLQRTDWRCRSPGHDDPSSWDVHADKVLI